MLGAGLVTITGVTTVMLQGDEDMATPRWFGLFVPGRDANAVDAIIAPLVRRPTVGAYFVKLDSEFTTRTLQSFAVKGLTPFLTLEPWGWKNKPFEMLPELSLARFNDGAYDEQLYRIAAQIAAFDAPVLLRLAHEFNGHWYPWSVGQNGNTAQDYVAFWKRVRAIFGAAPKIRWVWSCAAINKLRDVAPDIATLWPGDEFVDFAGTTGYGWEADARATYAKTFAKIATFTDKEFIIPEMGAQNGTNAVGVPAEAWTASMTSYLRENPRIRGFVWFHIGPEQNATGDYRLSQPEVFAALNKVLTGVPIGSNRLWRTNMSVPSATTLRSPVNGPVK